MPTTQTQTLRLERTFHATPQELWAAWTEPAQLRQWISPFPGTDNVEVHALEPRPGGRLDFTMIWPDGKRQREVGHYGRVEPYTLIEWVQPNENRDDAFDGIPTKATIRFEAVGTDKTKILFEQTLPPSLPLKDAAGGFNACFDKLDAVLAGKTPQGSHDRRIVATFFMTLDGVVEAPENWSFPYWGDETQAFKLAELGRSDVLLLGRKTYEGFAAAWPGRQDPDGFADKFNSMPKYVVSKTLKNPTWNNTKVISSDFEKEIRGLTHEHGHDIAVHGSVTLTRWLIAHDLLDELRILVYPLTLGKGVRLFDGVTPAKFKLVESKAFKTGVVSLIYQRAEPAPDAHGVPPQAAPAKSA